MVGSLGCEHILPGPVERVFYVYLTEYCEFIILSTNLKKNKIEESSIIAQGFTDDQIETAGVKSALLEINLQASNSRKKLKLSRSTRARISTLK